MRVKEAPSGPSPSAARKRAAVETIAREGSELKRVARRFSLCAADAEDAYQRSLEILMLKAPDLRPRELGRWMRTVVKHEALAVRAGRERGLGNAPRDGVEAVALAPAPEEGPERRAEELEDLARSREALGRLKPAELRTLTLLAAGYSYAEIGEITGFTRRKVQRSLVEGRDRFRRFLKLSEGGARCAAMGPLLSAFCDGETSPGDATTVREHLRACPGCRATLHAYRRASAGAAALAPALPVSRSLLERAQELLAGLGARLPGGAGDATVTQAVTAGAGRGIGPVAATKLLALCAGTVGGAACVATGVTPVPLDLGPPPAKEATTERMDEAPPAQVEYEPADPAPVEPLPEPRPVDAEPAQPAAEATAPEAEAGAVEYEPPPSPEPSPPPSGATGDGAAGEFGP